MANETIARRYSTALADVVMKKGDTETIKTELQTLGGLFQSNSELRSVFENPAIAHTDKEKVLDALVSKTRPSVTISNFLKVLLRNGRLTDITEISQRFDSVLQERQGVVSAEIISARELPAAERVEFEKNLEKITGKTINISYVIDENIIGGVVTRIGSTVFDGSVRTKLDNLKEQLIGKSSLDH